VANERYIRCGCFFDNDVNLKRPEKESFFSKIVMCQNKKRMLTLLESYVYEEK